MARRPECLARLYRPFWFDRQREFPAGETPVFAAPVFSPKDHGADELQARFSAHQIRGGYALQGEPFDDAGAASMEALIDLFDDETLSADFDLEPGQLQFADNRVLGHSRTQFADFPIRSAAATSSAYGCATTEGARIRGEAPPSISYIPQDERSGRPRYLTAIRKRPAGSRRPPCRFVWLGRPW